MSAALDRFFDHYYRRRPVNATFTGIHDHDAVLPDWSPNGLASLDDEMRACIADLAEAHPRPASAREYRDDVNSLDAELARGFLEIQLAENASPHGVRGNPALWTGEAVFAVLSIMIRDFAPLDNRIQSVTARLEAIPALIGQAIIVLGGASIPEAWTARALRDCEGAAILLAKGMTPWRRSASHTSWRATRLDTAATRAKGAFSRFAEWLRARPVAPNDTLACGPELFDLLLARGHQCTRSRASLLADARKQFAGAKRALAAATRKGRTTWEAVQEKLSANHPTADGLVGACESLWRSSRERAVEQDVVTWPEWPIRYVPLPEWTRDAAPFLYYLNYRSPAPFDPYTVYEYGVPLVAAAVDEQQRAWNCSVIKLNHVVHHGGIGHHLQNWHAYHRARSRVGKVAAVDCANRIGMFSGGSMAEGWACYATELMEELDFFSPLERIAQQHARLRMLGRAIVDLELHQRTMPFDDAIRFYHDEIGLSDGAARAEAVKNSMFPGTAIMYWLGTQGILDLREQMKKRQGRAFSLKAFHDELLGYGSIPVPLVARLMTEAVA